MSQFIIIIIHIITLNHKLMFSGFVLRATMEGINNTIGSMPHESQVACVSGGW